MKKLTNISDCVLSLLFIQDLLVKPSSRIVDIFHITSFVHDFAYAKTFGIASQNVVSFSMELSRRNNSNYGLE